MLATSTLRIGCSRLGVLLAGVIITALGGMAGAAKAGVPEDLIAYWNFNDWEGHPTSTTLSHSSGRAMRLRGNLAAGSGTPIEFVFSMSGYKDLTIHLAHRKDSHCQPDEPCGGVFNNGTWWWATGDDPESFTQLPGVDTLAAQGAAWSAHAVDFSAVLDINDAQTVIVRFLVSDPFVGQNTVNAYLDNIHIRANEIGGEEDALIAYWHFNDFDPAEPIVEADMGSGVLNTSQWGGDVLVDNIGTLVLAMHDPIPSPHGPLLSANVGAGTIDFTEWMAGASLTQGPFILAGTTLNALFGDAAGGRLGFGAGGWEHGFPGNFSTIDFKFSMTNRANLVMSFAENRGYTATNPPLFSFNTFAWSWSTDGVNFTDATEYTNLLTNNNWITRTLDFSSIEELNGAEEVTLRVMPSGANGHTHRIDNLRIHADPVEPFCAPADLDCNGVVNVFDLLDLLAAWGPCPGSPGECDGNCGGGTLDCSCDADCELFADCCPGVCFDCPSLGFCADCGDGTPAAYCPEPCPADLDNNTVVNVFDLLELLANWGPTG